MHTNICIYLFMYTMFTCTYAYTYYIPVHVRIPTHVHMHNQIHTFIYLCVYIYTHTFADKHRTQTSCRRRVAAFHRAGQNSFKVGRLEVLAAALEALGNSVDCGTLECTSTASSMRIANYLDHPLTS